MAQPISLNERIALAAKLAVRTKIFFDTWWLFENVDERPAIRDVLDEYYEFLRFDGHAHFVAFCVHICGLFDGDGRANSLPNLLKEVFPNLLPSDVEAELNGIRKTLRGVVILRNNLFAHRSNSLAYAKAFQLADVTPNQLAALCETSLSLANVMLLNRGLQPQEFSPLPMKCLREMLAALNSGTSTSPRL